MTNEGVIPTRFTVTSTTDASSSSSPTSPGLERSRTGRHPTAATSAISSSAGPEQLHRVGEGEGLQQQREEGIDPRRPTGAPREMELLEKASAVGDAGMKYPEGKGAIEVLYGGGELAGYGSTEIVVVFAPLAVGDFRAVKVCCCYIIYTRWYHRSRESVSLFVVLITLSCMPHKCLPVAFPATLVNKQRKLKPRMNEKVHAGLLFSCDDGSFGLLGQVKVGLASQFEAEHPLVLSAGSPPLPWKNGPRTRLNRHSFFPGNPLACCPDGVVLFSPPNPCVPFLPSLPFSARHR